MDYDHREEERQLQLLNNSNWDIVDDGRLSEHGVDLVEGEGEDGRGGQRELQIDAREEAFCSASYAAKWSAR